MTKHFKKTHKDNENLTSIQCEKCHKKLSCYNVLAKHLAVSCPQVHTKEVVKPLQCEMCFSWFRSRQSLGNHLARLCPVIHKEASVKPLQCEIFLSM